VHRLLATLEKRRFVAFDRSESKWHIGAQSFSVSATFARRSNFAAQALPYLRKLREQTRETANLAVVDDEAIIVLTRAESREIMRSQTKVGGRIAIVASGAGKAVLATYADEDVNAIIRHHGMPRLTENPSCGRSTCSASSRKSAARVLPSMTGGEHGPALHYRRRLQRLQRAAGRDLRLRHDHPHVR
jgi:DNA-binding IclR family transcriptional regulator